MSDLRSLSMTWLAGGVLGAIFFGGLWWTIRKGISSSRPALWFLGSLLLRMGIAVGGFYLVSGGHGRRLLACLLGFVMARFIVTWLTRPPPENQIRATREATHAP